MNHLTTNPRIMFQGNEYIFVGDDERTHGAIATVEQYENFEDSYAHLFPDGSIMRYRQQIGTRKDIKWLD